jgi:hypothetical protein
LNSYGFCITPNQYDSVQVRIWRKVERKDKTEEKLAEALLVKEEQYLKHPDEINHLTKTIRFKAARLNEGKPRFLYYLFSLSVDLLSYLRAHCLVMYHGPNF